MQCHEFTTKHGLHRVTTRTAGISDCEQYRWWLCRDWTNAHSCGEDKRVAWLMLNPSTADHRHDDPTIVRCMKFSASWGYSGMLVANLFPFRSSSPKACKAWADVFFKNSPDSYHVRDALSENSIVISKIASDCELHVVACGAYVIDGIHYEQMLDEFDHAQQLYCLGLSAAGAPLHPMARGRMRVPDDRQPIPFERS